VDINCKQICKISRKKDLSEVKIFQKVLGAGYLFLKHPVRFIQPGYSTSATSLTKLNRKKTVKNLKVSKC